MFDKVIVAIDQPAESVDAIAFARSVAPHAELLLASIVPYDDVRGLNPTPGFSPALRARIAAGLVELRESQRLTNTRILAIPAVSVAEGLRVVAEERGADLLVIGSARHAAFGRIVLGDVSRRVLRGASCPVAVVPRGTRPHLPPNRIGVAFDRSPESFAALETATQLATATGGTLTLAAAIEVGSVPEVDGYEDANYVDDLRAGIDRRLHEIASALTVPANVHVEIGSPRTVLAHLSTRADLIVTGSRGWGPLARVTLGSTSDWLIHHVQCPVVVVPKPATQPERPESTATGSILPNHREVPS